MAGADGGPEPLEKEEKERKKVARLAMMELSNMLSVPMSLHAIVRLNVPEAIYQSGLNAPLTAAQILSRLRPPPPSAADPSNLQRLLRMLASHGVFREHLGEDDGERRYTLTDVGMTLVPDDGGCGESYAAYVLQHHQEALVRAWPLLHEAVLDPAAEPFTRANGGVSAYAHYGKDPEANALMQRAMAGLSEPFMAVLLDHEAERGGGAFGAATAAGRKKMPPALQQPSGLGRLPLPSTPLAKPTSSSSSRKFPFRPLPPRSSRPAVVARAVALNANAQTRDRQRLKEQFEAARKRCFTAPTEGVFFTVDDFLNALDKCDVDPGVGAKVKGTVFSTDLNGAVVELTAKSSAFLPVQEACIYGVEHVAEAGIFPGFKGEFIIVGVNEADDSFLLSLRSIQHNLGWERCGQLQAEDAVVKGKIIGGNKGGVMVIAEGLHGFVPFSEILTKSSAEELIGKELPLKFMEVDEEQSRLVLSNCRAMTDGPAQLGIGSVVIGTVQSLKPYGAFVDIGGLTGLLHISQISHDHVADVSAVLQHGEVLKTLILSHDHENGRVSLSTKRLEPVPGDMIHNPKLVFEKADEMAQIFWQRIAQAEEVARTEMLGFQSESGLSLSSEVVLGSLTPDRSVNALDPTDAPPTAE